MRIHIKDKRGRSRFTVYVDLREPPTVVRLAEGQGPSVTLNWDRAVDDKHHLRRCPVCGSEGLYARKSMPQVTGFVVIALVAVVAMIVFGLSQVTWAVAVFFAIFVFDLVIYLFIGKSLVCYRCHSEFRGIPIRHNHPGWDQTAAERYVGERATGGGADAEESKHAGASS